MAKCSYCSTEIPPSTGCLYVRKDGKTFWYCSTKCERNNIKLKRKPQNLKWITKEKKK